MQYAVNAPFEEPHAVGPWLLQRPRSGSDLFVLPASTGASTAGKTALIKMLTRNGSSFPKDYSMVSQPAANRTLLSYLALPLCPPLLTEADKRLRCGARQTAGVDVVVAPLQVPSTSTQVELFLLDTAGHDMFAEVVPQYWGSVYYAMIVYDVTNLDSFETAKRWLDVLKSSRCAPRRHLLAALVLRSQHSLSCPASPFTALNCALPNGSMSYGGCHSHLAAGHGVAPTCMAAALFCCALHSVDTYQA